MAPFVLGRRLGRLAQKRWHGAALWSRAGLVLLALGVTFAVPLPNAWISVHDQAVIVLFFVAGLGLSRSPDAAPVPRAALILIALVSLLGLAGLEIWARAIGPRPAVYLGSVDKMHFLFRLADRDHRCQLLYPEAMDAEFVRRHWPTEPAKGQRVLHVGDSLVNALEVTREQRFTGVLEQLRPGEQHLSLAEGGMGPEAYLILLRKWLDAAGPDRVIVHVFLGNDVVTNPSYACCRDQPLLQAGHDGRLDLRCVRPQWQDGVARRWAMGPSPFALRVLATHSVAAMRLVDLLERRMREWTGEAHDQPEGWRTYDDMVARFREVMVAIRDEMRARKMPLQIALIPPRWAVTAAVVPEPDARVHRDVRAVLDAAQIPYADAWDTIAEAVHQHPETQWFYSENPQNPHFDVAGHRLYGQWLSELLTRTR